MQPTDPAHDLAHIKQSRDDATLMRQVITAIGELKTLIQLTPWLAHHAGNLAQIIRDAQDAHAFHADTDTPPEPEKPPSDGPISPIP